MRKLFKFGLQHSFITHNKLLNVFKLIGSRSPAPLAVIFQMTLKCNLRCKMCFQTEVKMFGSEQSYKTKKRGLGYDMDSSEFEKMLINLSEGNFLKLKPFFHITGGEPMVHPEFDEFLKLLYKYKFRTTLTTNAFFLEKHIDELFENKVLQLNISIDGNETVHDEIRGVAGSYARAVKGMKLLLEERRKRKLRRPRILINFVVNHSNVPEMKKIISHLDELGADVLRIQHIMFTENEQNDSNLVDTKLLAEMMKDLNNTSLKTPLVWAPNIKIEDIDRYYKMTGPDFNRSCNIPWILFWIMPNGDISPCFNNCIVGNLIDTPINKLWNNEAMKKFRDKLNREKLFPSCARCCFRQYY